MTDPAPYRRSYRPTQPDYLYPPYKSTVKRAPTKPLVAPPQTLSEVTGPLFGRDEVAAAEADLTRQHAGEPLGERIIVSGRVLDENGRAVRGYADRDLAGERRRPLPASDATTHDAPLDPNFTGCGRTSPTRTGVTRS